MNTNSTNERPEDDAYNIQRGRSLSRISADGPRSNSPSPMDDSPPSEIDYAEIVASENNIEMSAIGPLTSSNNLAQSFNFALPPSQPPRAANEATSDPASNGHSSASNEPSPPTVIPYSANVPADPSLWDGNFTATSLFGTNEFLNSDVRNIACSLQRMACFLRQRNLEGRNGNNIRHLDPFGESAWDFISAIFESGRDTLTTSNESTIRSNIAKEFSKKTNLPSKVNTRDGIQISKVPPPIPPRPSKKVLDKSRIFQKTFSVKGNSQVSYAQAASYVSNALKIKEAFPDLPNKKVLEIHNAAFAQPVNKTRKIQHTTKGPSRKQAIIPVPLDLAENIMGDASTHIFQINALLKNIKSTMRSEFIRPCSGGIAIITNNVPNPSDLSIIEKYFKSVEGINSNDIPSPRLPQSKSYLKITGLPYLRADGNKITSENVTEFMKQIDLFEDISLATNPEL